MISIFGGFFFLYVVRSLGPLCYVEQMNFMAEIIVAYTFDGLVWSLQTYSQTCIHKHKSTNTHVDKVDGFGGFDG